MITIEYRKVGNICLGCGEEIFHTGELYVFRKRGFLFGEESIYCRKCLHVRLKAEGLESKGIKRF